MNHYIILDSRAGTYILDHYGNKIDIGDYLEVKFLGLSNCEKLTGFPRPVIKATYDIEVHLSAIHNEDSILLTEFVSCSNRVNKFLATFMHLRPNKIVPMSIEFMQVKEWAWWWPKVDGMSMTENLLV